MFGSPDLRPAALVRTSRFPEEATDEDSGHEPHFAVGARADTHPMYLLIMKSTFIIK